MRTLLLVLLVVGSLFGCRSASEPIRPAPGTLLPGNPRLPSTVSNLLSTNPTLEVYFSPKGGCTSQIVAFIGSAKSEVLILAYSFTSKSIIAALLSQAAKTKGIFDRSNQGSAYVQQLTSVNIPVLIDNKHVIAHNKVIIKDGEYVQTGSFNYTEQAETGDAENCLFVKNKAIAQSYRNNWLLHQSHSIPFIASDAGIIKGDRSAEHQKK